MNYSRVTMQGGPLQQYVPNGWEWSKNGGSYTNNRDFLSIHWEVQERDPNSIRLHVEAPKLDVDPALNKLKKDIIDRILSSGIDSVIESQGLVFETGKRISDLCIQNNKSTEPFRVVITDRQRKASTKEDMEFVHASIGKCVSEIIQQFRDRLEEHFPRE